MDIKKISFIGSGNLATNLALAFFNKGYIINEVISLTESHAEKLARLCNSKFSVNISSLDCNTDLIIIAVPDHAIPLVANELSNVQIPVVHTSGTIDIDVLQSARHSHGVFYALQVFSKDKTVSFSHLPLGLEASSEELFESLHSLAISISDAVYKISSSQRRQLHLAAVFACNFTNMNYIIADTILKASGQSLELLIPLINETAERIATSDPAALQTGPARRNDKNVIDTHMRMLEDFNDYKKLYELYSQMIQKEFNEKL
jgi:predicted short-subunit dehydrogenase-like oxidoreductase (DUF2520 family)